jgi:hypothetical protein
MSDQELQDLRKVIRQTPPGVARIPLIEDAIRRADSLGYIEVAFNLRDELIYECNEYGQFLKAVVAWAWMLARIEEDKNEFPFNYNMSWNYRCVLARVGHFHSISMPQIEKLFADFQRHMSDLGATESSYHCRRLRLALILQDEEMSKDAIKGILTSKKDSYTDCEACRQNMYIQNEIYFGNYDKMLSLWKPIKKSQMGCNMIPLRTYAYMVNHAHRNGDLELAAEASEKGIRAIGNKSGFVELIGLHLIYLAETDMTKAASLFKKTLKWSLNDTEPPWGVMHFHMGAGAFFARKKNGKMTLDSRYPMYEPTGAYDSAKLAEYHLGEAARLADLFDKRNGTKAIGDMVRIERERL